MVATHQDIDSMIQIGYVYRRNEQFQEAVDAYDTAQKEMGGTITDSSTYKAVFDATNDFTILGKEAGSIFKLGKPDETD